MLVRPARVEDAAACAEVHVRSWQAAYAHVFGEERLSRIDPERRVGQWRRRLSEPRPRSAAFVAEEDGRVVAMTDVGECRETPGEGELFVLYALPEAWGGGAGPALMAAAVEALREHGFAEASLWVLEDNPRARRFYEREGWSPDGGRREGEHLGVRTFEVRYRRSL